MRKAFLITAAVLALTSGQALAANDAVRVIVIKNHHFEPTDVKIPADQRVKLLIDNQDPTPEEFESRDLRREKIVPGNTKATVWIGPLKTGEYHFSGEYNEDTAQGTLIVE